MDKDFSSIDKGFKELIERLAEYETYGLKEYKDTFIVRIGSNWPNNGIVALWKIRRKWMEIAYPRSR